MKIFLRLNIPQSSDDKFSEIDSRDSDNENVSVESFGDSIEEIEPFNENNREAIRKEKILNLEMERKKIFEMKSVIENVSHGEMDYKTASMTLQNISFQQQRIRKEMERFVEKESSPARNI